MKIEYICDGCGRSDCNTLEILFLKSYITKNKTYNIFRFCPECQNEIIKTLRNSPKKRDKNKELLIY